MVLLLCLLQGLVVTGGLTYPPDLDALRDIGFAQSFLDGDMFRDPTYRDAARYYSPLVAALLALLAWATGTSDLPRMWVLTGPWIGLLLPLGYYLACRALLGGSAAVFALTVLVVAGGTLGVPWVFSGYTPWLLTPLVAQALFLFAIPLVLHASRRASWPAVIACGLAMGVIGLAHLVPGMLLGLLLATGLVAGHGLSRGVVLRLLVAAGLQLVVMSPYLLPVFLLHPHGVVHAAPGAWTDNALLPTASSCLTLLAIGLPGVIAGLVLVRGQRLGRIEAALLMSWLGICLALLARYYACTGLPADALVCRVLRLPPHHWHLYLMAVNAALIGLALSTWVRTRPALFPSGLAPAFLVALVAASMFFRSYDMSARSAALADTPPFYPDLYRQLLALPPSAVAVTRGGDNFDPADFAVMAAGRQLLAAHPLFSNPYVDYVTRQRNRQAALAWLQGAPAAACPAQLLYAALPADLPVDPARVTRVWAKRKVVLWRVICS